MEREEVKHLQENLNSYVEGRINASERRVLFTKLVGATWEELSSKTDMIVRSFEKYGISVAPNGSEDEKMISMGWRTTVLIVMMMKTHFQMKRGRKIEEWIWRKTKTLLAKKMTS